ncbi:unnamed protein product [Symbiodinium natans]|uniref:Uncharacterized protein n=1 Tax=Symbiodinium natans TaxID=878477 RepID=A0A812J1K7_9DINO|nr:unnamed protein product [Symbiodinium natans]
MPWLSASVPLLILGLDGAARHGAVFHQLADDGRIAQALTEMQSAVAHQHRSEASGSFGPRYSYLYVPMWHPWPLCPNCPNLMCPVSPAFAEAWRCLGALALRRAPRAMRATRATRALLQHPQAAQHKLEERLERSSGAW